MAAFAIKASAVLCKGAMGIIGRPREAHCHGYVPSPDEEARKNGTPMPGGEAAAASCRRGPARAWHHFLHGGAGPNKLSPGLTIVNSTGSAVMVRLARSEEH